MIKIDDLPETAGVYMIIHTPSKRFYIGSTNNFQTRWKGHLSTLTHQYHSNSKFQNFWNENRAEDFEFEILEVIATPNQTVLVECENKWMTLFLIPGNPRAFNPRQAVHKIESGWEDPEHNILVHYYKGKIVDRTVFKVGKA